MSHAPQNHSSIEVRAESLKLEVGGHIALSNAHVDIEASCIILNKAGGVMGRVSYGNPDTCAFVTYAGYAGLHGHSGGECFCTTDSLTPPTVAAIYLAARASPPTHPDAMRQLFVNISSGDTAGQYQLHSAYHLNSAYGSNAMLVARVLPLPGKLWRIEPLGVDLYIATVPELDRHAAVHFAG